MRHCLLIALFLGVLGLPLIAQTYVTYYINIDNAPNGIAEGIMKAYYPGYPNSVMEKELVFIENYYGGAGGKYFATMLPQGSPTQYVTIKCEACKRWGDTFLWGYSEQTFTGGSGTYLPTMHIQ